MDRPDTSKNHIYPLLRSSRAKEFTTNRAKQELFLVFLLSNVELNYFMTYMQNKNTKHLDETVV